jgi:hypothetical protein
MASMKRITALVFVGVLGLPSIAAADYTNFAVGTTGGSIASGLTFTAIDVVARPKSKLYGGVELGVNAALAGSQFYLAATLVVPDDESNFFNYAAAGLGVWNFALAVHGGYLLLRNERDQAPGLAFDVGGVRSIVVPTTVSDGYAVGAGALVGGTF